MKAIQNCTTLQRGYKLPKKMSKSTQTIVIEAGRASKEYWSDMWRQRELLFFLIWRDLLVRYKQTMVGVAWVLLKPAITLAIFSVVFGKWAALPSGGLPYPLVVFAGMLPWFFFSTAVSDCSNSIINNSSIVGKIYFPRLLIPVNSLLVALVDYAVSCSLIVVLVIWTGFYPDWRIAMLPLLTIWVAALSFGFGVWGAALNVRHRDLRFIIPFLLQLGIYISPVGYSAAIVPERFKLLYSLNPMVGIIDSFRWAILGGSFDVYLPGVMISAGVTIILVVTGVIYFRRVEKMFADYL